MAGGLDGTAELPQRVRAKPNTFPIDWCRVPDRLPASLQRLRKRPDGTACPEDALCCVPTVQHRPRPPPEATMASLTKTAIPRHILEVILPENHPAAAIPKTR